MISAVKRLLTICTLFLLLLAGAVWFVLTTERGLSWTLGWMAPASFSVQTVQGTLLGPVVLKGLSYQDANLELQIESARLEWSPEALWSRHLEITQLRIEGLALRLKEQPEKKREPFRWPELPLRITLGDGEVSAFILANEQEIFFAGDRLQLSAALEGDRLTIHSSALNATEFDLQASGSAEGADQQVSFDMVAQLQMDERWLPGGQAQAQWQGTYHSDAEQVDLASINLRLPDQNIEINGEARWSLREQRLEAADLSWPTLRWPLTETPLMISDAGRLQISGEVEIGRAHV